MDKEIKSLALKQYLHYFRIWFIAVGALAICTAVMLAVSAFTGKERGNGEAPRERVYDEADVLTTQEEEKLRAYIARQEKKLEADIIVVTINEDVEAKGSWNSVMMNLADDFYDGMKYGYNKIYGDGILLLDNWYENQEGCWVSTCGSVYERLSSAEIDRIVAAVNASAEKSPYEAYRAFVSETENQLKASIPWWVILVAPLVLAFIYAAMHLKQSKAEDTTQALTFVESGKPVVNDKRDVFIRKNVVTRKIETSNSGTRSGSGGGHKSSSGVRHGGGGGRR